MALIKCAECSEEYSDKLTTCPHCGFTPKLIVCPECGSICNISSQLCANCGFNLSDATGKQPAQHSFIQESYQGLIEKTKAAKTASQWNKLMRQFSEFGDYELATSYVAQCRDMAQEQKDAETIEKDYEAAVASLSMEQTLDERKELAAKFMSFGDYKDAKEKLEICNAKVTELTYEESVSMLDSANSKAEWEKLASTFSSLGDYKDAKEKVTICNEKLAEIKKKKKKTGIIISSVIVVVLAVCAIAIASVKYVIPNHHYQAAQEALANEDYALALEEFTAAGDFRDAPQFSTYVSAIVTFEEGDYVQAASLFQETVDIEGSEQWIFDCGKQLIEEGEYKKAIDVLKGLNSDYDGAEEYQAYARGMINLNSRIYSDAIENFQKCQGIEDSTERLLESKFGQAEQYYKAGSLNLAKEKYMALPVDYERDGITVSNRLQTLEKFNAYLEMCGRWTATADGEITVKKIGSYGYSDGWVLNENKGNSLTVRCVISDDNTITLNGNIEYFRFTNYSILGSQMRGSDLTQAFSKVVTSIPKNLEVAENFKLTFSGNKFTMSFSMTDKSEDIYFNYLYTSKCTYDSRVEAY